MNVRQWEIWKAKTSGFETEHGFVILSPPERPAEPHFAKINGLDGFGLRGERLPAEALLNSAAGVEAPTVCRCDLVYFLDKSKRHSPLGRASRERQQPIKRKLAEVLRLTPS